MPEMVDVASHFDDIPAVDAYSSVYAFDAQFSSFQESAPDGTTAKKRTMSVRPSVTIPTRRVITFMGETWIIGDGNVDGFQATQVRQAYWMKKSSGLATKLTPGQLVSSSAGYDLYANQEYFKDTVNSITDSEYDPFWLINIASTETASKGHYIRIGNTLSRVRSFHLETAGFNVLQCDQLDSSNLVTASITSGTYDPVTDTNTVTAANLAGVLLEPSKFYRLATQADPKYNAGDMNFVTSSNLAVGTTLIINSVTYRAIAKQAELDAWNIQLRVV